VAFEEVMPVSCPPGPSVESPAPLPRERNEESGTWTGMDWTDRGRRRLHALARPPVPPAHTQSTPVRPCVPGYQDQAPPAADKGGPLVFCSCCRCQFIALAWNCFLRWLRGNSNKLRLCQAILHRSTLYIGCLHWGLTEEMRKGWHWLGCLPACWCLWPWIYLQICAAQETGSCRGLGIVLFVLRREAAKSHRQRKT